MMIEPLKDSTENKPVKPCGQIVLENTAPVENTMKIEWEEVEIDAKKSRGSFGVDQVAWELVKHEYENLEDIIFHRIKIEHTYAKTSIKCSNEEHFKMQNIEIKLENDLGNNQFEVSQITNEFIIKDENDQFIDTSAAETVPDRIYRECDTEKNNANASFIRDPEVSYKLNTCIHCNTTFESKINLDDHIIKNHLEFISSISSNVHQCTHCTYITTLETSLAEHMLQHPAAEYSNERIVCIYCSATFSSKLCLDDHILKKHPESIASVSSKIHECTNCTYKTTLRENLRQHMLKHFDAKRIYKTGVVCIHCNATYSRKIYLDDHILKKHPESKASVSGKIHECTNCTYKTTLREHWRQHVLKHIDAKRIYKTGFVCIHCNATFTTKVRLDDHILMKHPEFKSSISSEIYECAHCTYKTTLKHSLVKHMSNHSGAKGSINSSVCIHCNAIFTRKICLDGHILRKHPEFITSVSSKIHECAYCTCKTNLTNPMLNYPGAEGSYKFSVCIHCNATFMRKVHLDDHILKKHPEHISPSIAKKIRECTDCTYKTTIKHNFTRHILQHSGAKTVYKNSVCIHCNATYSRKLGLDDHILRKHPEFAASVSSKIHGCANCTYKTTSKDNFRKHMLKHSSAKIYKSSVVCTHCNARFKRKSRLNDHILVKHPDFTVSITSKIYKCAHCTYKTTLKYSLVKHMLNHPGATGSINFNVCIHCNATFTRKMCVDDHILKKHPEFISSVSSKIHECTNCTYKTTSKDNLRKHLLKHSAAKKVSKSSVVCIHCNTLFSRKICLDDHILKKHPDFIASVSSKIHECEYCVFKTVIKSHLVSHLEKHSGTEGICGRKTCVHCNAIFACKSNLDDHKIKKHPDFIAEVYSKIYACTHCSYKTSRMTCFARHMLKHPDAEGRYKCSKCVHCGATLTSKENLHNHIIRKHPELYS